jgi:hypothetical protein
MITKWAGQPRPTITVGAHDPARAIVQFEWQGANDPAQLRHYHALRLHDGKIVEIRGYRTEREARQHLRF